MKRPELLSPAGDMESLTAAAEFGADAVYIGGSSFSMRSAPANFTMPQIRAAASYLHGCGKKLYVACNVLPRNDELGDIEAFLYNAAQAGADAFIISDMGVLELAKKTAPQVDIHISTQTGVVNYAAANALFSYGAKRIVLAREVSLREIAQIRAHIPASLELEAFIHGSMCVSFSGRCLLSNYLAARDGNHGECAQPCRWNYALCEETRPGEYMPISEDGTGTHILSSKDLRMIEHIPEMLAAGISSLKIEGRAKSACYTAAVTNAYRMAVDSYLETGCEAPDPKIIAETDLVSHREYCTGFYFGPIKHGQDYSGHYDRGCTIVAVARSGGDCAQYRQKNRFSEGDELEALEPGKTGERIGIISMLDGDMRQISEASEPDMQLFIRTDRPVKPGTMLRRRK